MEGPVVGPNPSGRNLRHAIMENLNESRFLIDLARRIGACASRFLGRECPRALFRPSRGRVIPLPRDQRGFNFLEVLVAVAILGVAGVGILTGLSTGFRAEDINTENVVGENLVRAVLEDIRFQSYQDSYTVTVTVPVGYSFTIDTVPFCTPEPCTPDNNVQKNTVTILRGGEGVFAVEDLKVRR